jgi:hypothetical protein
MELESFAKARPLTASYVQWIMVYCPNLLSAEDQCRVLEAIRSALVVTPTQRPPPRFDEREEEVRKPHSLSSLKVFSNYILLQNLKSELNFTLVNENSADFLFPTQNVTDFHSLDSKHRVSQFPFEGGFVCKVS